MNIPDNGASAESQTFTPEDVLPVLATLPPDKYESVRQKAAKLLGWRVAFLDAEVDKRRPPVVGTSSGETGLVKATEPWPDPVVGEDLLLAICQRVSQHVHLQDRIALVSIALWVVFTYLLDKVEFNPRLLITSPTKRCGKTTLLGVLAEMVDKALPSSNVSTAALYRVIDLYHPTLLIDEADTFLENRGEMVGIINAGHSRSASCIIRCAGDDHQPKPFSCWSPLVIAMNGRPPDTIVDRSMVIRMTRKAANQKLLSMDATSREAMRELGRKAARWAQDNASAVAQRVPVLPSALNSRAGNSWEPLLAIAEVIGGGWPQVARQAAVDLAAAAGEDEDESVMLLRDLKHLFDVTSSKAIASKAICDQLNSLEDRPWGTARGRGLTQHDLAKRLKPFGVSSGNVRIGTKVNKGYRSDDFQGLWERFL